MSSAILYLAIVAIWACVLIPRWLRRDSAHWMADGAADASDPADDDGVRECDTAARGDTAIRGDAGDDDRDGDRAGGAWPPSGDADEAPRRVPVPAADAEQARRRMLAARRRLLVMLVVLEGAAVALAVLKLAALWVVIPPTIMLVGYLLLLREAANADAERAQREAEAASARARARRARAQARAARHDTPADGTPVTPAAALAARFAAAPVPADHEDGAPGRDFAPGLAGKYTTSYADAGYVDSEHTDAEYTDADLADDDYDYEQPRLRAVGD